MTLDPSALRQVQIIDGQTVLMFSSAGGGVASRRNSYGGIWAARAENLLGPYDVDTAEVVLDPSMYVGKLIRAAATGPGS
jgi:beta-fructofuranosidase